MNNTALETYLEPLKRIFDKDNVNEVCINKPGEVWIEQKGDIYSELIPALDLDHLKGLAMLVARSTEQKISEEMPLLSAKRSGSTYTQLSPLRQILD
jgi:type IV secretion system protein VirB11